MLRVRAARYAVGLSLLAIASIAFAANFTLSSNTTSGQTLAPSSGGTDTGTINSGVSLTVSGSGPAITVTGGSGTRTATINNSGTISQTGTGRAIRNSSGAAVINISNASGATISAAGDDAFQASVTGTSVTVNNSGTIVSSVARALNTRDATGTLSFTNTATGILRGIAGDAVRAGSNAAVINSGLIQAQPDTTSVSGVIQADSDDGIDAQGCSGVVVTNNSGGTISGRHGVTGGGNNACGPVLTPASNFNITVNNKAGATITGINGSGINIDTYSSFLGNATVTNDGTITGNYDSTKYNTGDGDGVDVDGILTLINNGIIRGTGAGSTDGSNNPEGVSIGGGSITNNAGAEITGQNSNGTVGKGHGVLVDDSSGGNAIAATTISNAGLIRGYDSYAIRIINSSFANSITNTSSGSIRGGGNAAEGAAIQTGDGADTLTNRGSIVGDNGLAIDLGAGNDTLHIYSGAPAISGDISGGAGSNTLDFDTVASFSYSGVLSNFASVEIKSGSVVLSGANTYSGNTTITAGSLLANNSSGSATGTGSVTVKSGATLGGSGTVGAVIAESGSLIAPGATRGTLTASSLSLVAGSRLQFELGSPSDQLVVTGTLNYGGSGTATIDIIDSGITAGSDYTLIRFGGASGFATANVALGAVPSGVNATLEVTASALILHVAADVSLSPTSLSFPSTVVGVTSAAQTVSFTYSGASSLTVGTPTITGSNSADFSISATTCGGTLTANASCSVSVTFTPSAASSRSASLSIPSNSSSSPSLVPLSGTGVAANASLQASAASLNFGNQPVNTSGASQTITLTNNGNVSVTVSSLVAGGNNPGEFIIGSDGCSGRALAVAASCSISVSFSPTASGNRSASRSVSTSPALSSGALSLSFSGVGTQAAVSLNPASLSFANQTVGSSSAAQTVALSNGGNTALAITSISASGDFTQTNNCGTTLPATSSCAIDVSFTPTSTGTRSGSLGIISSGPSSPDFAPLSGTGIQAAIGTSGPLSFGSVVVGTSSAAQSVLVTNTGTAALNIGAPSISGSNSSEFSISSNGCGASIAPNASCSIGITFAPGATGTRSATLSIPSNAPNSPTSVSLSGSGIQANASLSAASLSFGDQPVATTSVSQTLVLSNSGSSSLTISSISTSAEFAQTNNCGASVAAGSSCNISVSFTPAAPGARSGSLSIASNAATSPTIASLSGNGTQAALSTSGPLAFGSQNVGSSSVEQFVTISNSGTAALNVGTPSISGGSSGDFAISSNTCSASVAPGNSCSIGLRFTPAIAGARSASLQIPSNAPNSPASVALTGTGTGFRVTASDNTAKTLNPAGGTTQTGTVISSGDLNTAGSAVPITVSGTGTAVVDNSGRIRQTGSGRAIVNSSGAVTLSISNKAGALIQAAEADAIRSSVAGANLSLDNAGSVIVAPNSTVGGNQAIDWNGITTGSNTINNQAGGTLQATAADAVRPGVNGVITNAGTIQAIPVLDSTVALPAKAATSSDGIDAQNNSGVSVTNSGTISGRHGITGGTASSATFTITVTNNASGTLSGINGSGVNIDSFTDVNDPHHIIGLGNAVVTNDGTITGNFDAAHFTSGDGDGVDVDGLVTIVNNGIIRALGSGGAGSDGQGSNPEGVSIGGGSITNNAGAEITGQDTSGSGTKGHGVLVDDSGGGNAPGATTIVNAGLIRGYDSYAIRIIDTFADTITNKAGGIIRGGGDALEGAAIQTGDGDDVISNSGSIIGGNGLAIDLEAGNDTLHVVGANASISGDISGGAGSNSLDFDPGSSASFSYGGALSNFSSVEIKSGSVTLSGASTYDGATRVSGGSLVVANSSGSATGTGLVTVSNGASLAGSGSVAAVSVNSGGSLLPSGTLSTSGDAAIADGAHLLFKLGSTSDQLRIGAALSVAGVAVVDISDNGLQTGTDYTLISFGSASGLTAANFALGTIPSGLEASIDVTASAVILRTSAQIDISPGSLSFGSTVVGSSAAAQTVTISNTGTIPLHVGTPSLGGLQPGDFSIASSNCGSAVAVGSSCSIAVRFAPTAAGSRTASLSIASNAAGSPSLVALSGSAAAVNVSVQPSPAITAFGNQPVASSSNAQTVMLSNNGNVSVTVTGLSAGGSHPADFALVADGCSGHSLAVGASCTLGFTFTPGAAGDRSVSETIATSPALSGGSVSFALTGTGTQPMTSLSPSSLSFSPQLVGTSSAAQTLTLSNSGSNTLAITSISASGDFAQSNACGAFLAPSASCSIDVRFAPGAPGSRSGALNIISSAPSSPDRVTLTGTGTQPALGVSSGSLNFGNQTVGTRSSFQSLTLSNSGTAMLSVGTPTISGAQAADFAIAGNSCVGAIGPGKSCSISLSFTPAAIGTRGASLSIPSNAPNSPALVALSGNGQAVTGKPGTLALAAAGVAVKEQAGSVQFKVTRSGGKDGAVSVQYATHDGTALAGADYTATSGTLVWQAGDASAQLVTVPITDDLLVEDKERFTLELSAPAGGATLGRASSEAVITSDDVAGALSFSVSSVSVNENAGSLTVTVRRTAGKGNDIGVHYASSAGTATAGSDFGSVAGDLSWAAGDTSDRHFSIPIVWDTLAEKAEKFSLVLSAPSGGAKLGSPKTQTVTITNVNH